jgi:hypothetical protein
LPVQDTTLVAGFTFPVPVGMCVILTAESVLFTC